MYRLAYALLIGVAATMGLLAVVASVVLDRRHHPVGGRHLGDEAAIRRDEALHAEADAEDRGARSTQIGG